jgi:hypothetical protein
MTTLPDFHRIARLHDLEEHPDYWERDWDEEEGGDENNA